MEEKWKIVHYLNQFFAGIGGEEEARAGLSEVDGPVGSGRALETVLNGRGSVVTTIYCGDDYFVENQDETVAEALKIIKRRKPDLFIAGPAFNAGRYGQAGHPPAWYDRQVRVVTEPPAGADRGCLERLHRAHIKFRFLDGVKGVKTPVEVLDHSLDASVLY